VVIPTASFAYRTPPTSCAVRRPSDVDASVHREVDAGIIVSGAKVAATSAAKRCMADYDEHRWVTETWLGPRETA
jgi:hypothetical protein